ncbi:MAG: hypothetical protein ACHQFX_17145 [Chitinophagales bacterium]
MKKPGFALFYFGALFLVIACKHKEEKKDEERFFPVLPIIRSQVAEVDTSLYSIRKITFIDSITSDTVFYRREQFGDLANDFLMLPDISDPKFKGRYKEEKQFDESLNRAIFRYLPVNPDNELIQRQQLLIRPGPPEDKITSIIIDYMITNRDSSVQKNMLWQVDKSFQVTTIRQLAGQKETTNTYKVIWSEGSDE